MIAITNHHSTPMKILTQIRNLLRCFGHRCRGLLLPLAALLAAPAMIHAQPSALTYQGALTQNGAPASGLFDFQFKLCTAATNGGQVGVTLTSTALPVSNGLFTATLDFGAAAFPGAERWLQLETSTNGAAACVPLSPRQRITSAPYALHASDANLAATATTADGVSTGAATANSATTATSAANFTGALAGNVTGTQSATVVASVGGQTAANVASGTVAANAATSANTASTIVKRDASGNFAAGAITAASETLNPGVGTTGLTVNGSRSGNFSAALAFIQNTNPGSAGPALRLHGTGNAVDGVLNVGNSGTGKIIAFGAASGEVANLDTNGNLSFGSQTRQMLNLWGSVYGIGVQSGTLYQRSDYRQVNACTQTNAGGTVVGSYTAQGPFPPQQVCEFNSAAGIKEIQIRSDFCENSISYFVIRSGASGTGVDAGLRAPDGAATIRIACEFPIGTNALNSAIRFSKNGINCGVILTDTNSANASNIRF